MAQHDFDIANQTFPNFRSDLNDALEAAATISAGASSPSTTYAYQLWFDTSSNTYKVRDGANSAWINFAGVDGSGDISFDTDTLYVDSTNNRVGVGTTSPSAPLGVNGRITLGDQASSGTAGAGSMVVGAGVFYIQSSENQNSSTKAPIVFSNIGGSSESMRIDNDGLKFNGDTAAANALDDYEEGTFTPTLSGGFSSAPTSYSQNSGTYTKIGRYVYFALDLHANGATASGSHLTIGGLPFASLGLAFGGASYSYQIAFNTNVSDIYHITYNSSVVGVYTSAGGIRSGNAAGININARVILFGSYQAA